MRIVGPALLAGLAVGCAPSEADIEAMMQQPERPAEIDRLEGFVGKWNMTMNMPMPGNEESTFSGTHESQWDADRWMLVEKFDHEMGEGSTMKGVNLMWWDAHSRIYRMSATDNYGGRHEATLDYCEKSEKWYTKGFKVDRDGNKSHMRGTMHFENPSTMVWTFDGYIDGLGLFKMWSGTGTSTRQ
jgi:hypothetical protein